MPKIISIPSRKIEAEFPDSMPDEEIKSILKQKYPRTGDDVAYDVSQFSNIADTRDFIAKMPVNEYVMLNNYSADKKLSWGEIAGVAGEAIGTIVGDVVKGAGATVTKAGDGVAESALRGVAAGTVDLVSLGHKLVTPNVRIPTFDEFVAKTPITTRLVDSPQKQGATGLTYAWPSEEVSATTEDDYKQFINQQRQMELQSLDIADISEKLIQGAPVPEVAKGFSYLDAVTLAGLAKSVARSGVKSIYKAAAKQPLAAATGVVPDIAAKGAYTGFETGTSFVPKNPFVANAEKFATKVGEGARKAGLTGVEYGFKGVEKTADLGAGIIKVAERLGLENAALRGTVGGAIGYQEGGTQGAILGTVGGAIIPKAIKKTFQGISRGADFIGAAAKVGKSGPSRTGIFEKMAQAANISPGARGIAEKVLFTQPFVQYASDAVKQAAKNALLGAGVGAALGYAADGEEGAAAGFGSGFAVGGMTGVFDASYDAMKSIAGRSTARSERNAAGDINSFVNDITDDQARSDYGEIMNRAIQIAGPERAADMLDSLRLAEGMGANVKVDKKAFNSFAYDGTNGGTITINPDRMNAGSVGHEVFHQLFNVGVRGELQAALSDVYLPKKDADGNIIQNGLFDDKEFAKKAAELAEKYKDNPRGYKDALEAASVLDNPAGFSPEAVDNARSFVIDEMTASYTEKFMGRSRTGVFNPDRLPMWHRQILENIDDKILNRINDKVFANKSVKDPTAFFTDAEGKPVRVPQLDSVLNRAFKSKLGRDKSAVGKPREVVAPKNPRELASWAAATFGATRDVLDPTGQRPLTEQERKVITAADFDAAKALYQSLPDEEKQTVRVTKKSGVPTDINSKGARIEITSQTPSNVFESFLQVAKDRGMGNQQLANMRQLYASMALDDGPTFDTVNNPVYKYNPKTGKMTPGVRPASRQEVYPTAITVNSAGGFNVEYIDLSRVKANAEKILKNPEYKGVWNGLDDFMTDFGSSLRNLSKGKTAAMSSAELLGKGNDKVGAMKRDLIAEAMNVTLPRRLQGEGEDKGYKNQPTIDPLTLATKEGKDRRTEGSAFRDFRVERLTNVTPTNNRLKMVKEDAYDILVRRFQPDAFTPESLPNGESFTNPDGYRILNKAGSKLFRTYDDTGKLIGIAESREKAMKKAQDEFVKKAMKEESIVLKSASKSPTEMRFQAVTPEEFKAQVDAGYKDALTKVASISDDYLRKVADTFIKIAKKPEAFIANKQSKSKNVQEIVKDLGVLKTPQKEGIIVDDLGYLAVPKVGGANVIRLKTNEGMTHIFHSAGYVWADLSLATNKDARGASVNAYANPLKRSKNDLGQATYQTMGLFAKNNGFKLIPDPNGVSEVASIRRVDAMLAAALRTGDTSFIDIDIPGWTKGKDFKKDVGLLASLSAEYVAHFFPQINDLKISKDGTKVIYDGKSFTPKEFEKSLFIEGKTPVETTVGEKTLRRALLAKLNTMGIEGKDMAGLLDDGVQPMRDNQQTSITSSGDDKTRALFAQSIGTKIMFQPDPTSPNILNGSNGSRIIKSTSGKYRVYLATGALAGVKDTLESAQKLVQAKSNK